MTSDLCVVYLFIFGCTVNDRWEIFNCPYIGQRLCRLCPYVVVVVGLVIDYFPRRPKKYIGQRKPVLSKRGDQCFVSSLYQKELLDSSGTVIGWYYFFNFFYIGVTVECSRLHRYSAVPVEFRCTAFVLLLL